MNGSSSFDPYVAPAHDPRLAPPSQQAAPMIGVFAALNFAFAVFSFLGVLGIGAALIYGVFYSGDQGRELAAGVAGSLVLGSPAALGLVIYFVAGIGLVRRRTWGYYLHLAGAVLAAISCIGVIYTILAFVFAMRPDFSNAFFQPSTSRAEVPI